MNKIVKNYIYNLLYNVLVLLAPLITAPYLARVLGATRLGIYSYVNSVTSVVISISLVGLSSYGSRQVAYERDDKEHLSKIFSNIISLRFGLGILGTLIYFLFAGFSNYQYYFALYYIYYLGNVLDCTWLFVGVEDMKIPALKNTLAKIISIAGIFLLVKTKDDLSKYIFILAISSFIGMIVSYPQLRKYIFPQKPDIKSFVQHYKGALILFLPGLVSTIYLQIDKVMIEWLTNKTDQISFYDQAEKIVMIPLTFITVLSTVMMPRIANEFANNHKKSIENLLIKSCKVSLFLAYPLMFGIAAIANDFIPWYLGEEFSATITALVILSPIVISNTLVGISGTQYFIATNQTGILLKSNIFAAIMNIVINAILIPRYGYVGAAAATLLSNYTLVIVQYFTLGKQIKIRKMFRHTFKYFISSIIMFGVVFGISVIRDSSPLTTITQIVTGAVVYFAIMLLTHDTLTQEILVQVVRKAKRKNE